MNWRSQKQTQSKPISQHTTGNGLVRLPGFFDGTDFDRFIGFMAAGAVAGAEDQNRGIEFLEVGAVRCESGGLCFMNSRCFTNRFYEWRICGCFHRADSTDDGNPRRKIRILFLDAHAKGFQVFDNLLVILFRQGADVYFETAGVGDDIRCGAAGDAIRTDGASAQQRMGFMRDFPALQPVQQSVHF